MNNLLSYPLTPIRGATCDEEELVAIGRGFTIPATHTEQPQDFELLDHRLRRHSFLAISDTHTFFDFGLCRKAYETTLGGLAVFGEG